MFEGKMLLCHSGTQSILSLCQRKIGEFHSVCVFMVVVFSFKKRASRSGGSLQEWRLPLPQEERSMLKQRRFLGVQDGPGGGEEESTEVGNLQLNREI